LHSDAGTKVRLGLECDGDRVSLFTCNGYDWTKRYPWIVESTLEAVRH
jgi:ATP-dependent DNA ligase